jgi:murein DD-endopeptidase MepM/ murein hydrolase activator NlpD
VVRASLAAALILTLVGGTPAAPASAATGSESNEIQYRYPFDPAATTPKGGEFGSKMANGKPRKSPHRGHDFSFANARGAAIPAIAAGIVRNSATEGPLGNRVVIEHADGAFSAYAHMDSPTPLEIGQHVELGQTVGYIGSTPDVPVHLHLTMGWTADVMDGIGTFDPLPYIAERLHVEPPHVEEPARVKKPAPAEHPHPETFLTEHSGAMAV